MREIVKRFNAAGNLIKIKYTCHELDPKTGKRLKTGKKEQKEKVKEETMLDDRSKEELQRMLNLVDNKLTPSTKQEPLSNGLG